MAAKVVLVSLVYLVVYAAAERCPGVRICSENEQQQEERPQQQARECQLERLSRSQPAFRVEAEGGMTEFWDQNDEQLQCAGVYATKDTIQPYSLTVPAYFPAPRMIYIERGKGVIGMSFPGCPETYHSEQQSRRPGGKSSSPEDLHQKLHRVRRGDIVVVPSGVPHWMYNDRNEELVAVNVFHLDNPNNQLDNNNFRQFLLAGYLSRGQGQQGQQQQQQQPFRNIFSGLDANLVAEALNVPTEVVNKMQENDYRGHIIKSGQELGILLPDDKGEQQEGACRAQRNGLEESICSMEVRHNLQTKKKADLFTKQAGKINFVNQAKLPILRYVRMSAEKGHMMPNAVYTPKWSMTNHRINYAIRGDLDVQIVDDNGNTVMNERINQGDIFVIPQFYPSISKAGNEGFEWVTFKTHEDPMKNPLAGYISVMKAMPNDVITNSYQDVLPQEAQKLKTNRDPQSILFSPTKRSSCYSWREILRMPTDATAAA